MSKVVRFYFSFRSPYSWLGFYRLQKIIDKLPVSVEYIPAYSKKKSAVDDPVNNKLKLMYIGRDIKRFTSAYGLQLNWPQSVDTDWQLPHLFFLYAMDKDLGPEFALKVYSARFEQGLDVGDEEVLKNIGIEIGLDPNEMMGVVNDKHYLDRFDELQEVKRRDKLFGVPFFIYNENKYWGNDRLEWLIRDIYQSNNINIPDLSTDPFLRPF